METIQNWIQHEILDSTEMFDAVVSNPQSSNPSPAVYMVPEDIRVMNPNSYSPRVISIGPLHRDESHLEAMENHKQDFVNRLLYHAFESTKKSTELLKTMKESLKALKQLTRRIFLQKFYDFPKSSITLKHLIKILFIDGCFLLEFIYGYVYEPDVLMKIYPVLSNPFLIRNLIIDLLLLENQIPLDVLTSLFPITLQKIHQDVSSIDKLLILFLNKTSVFQGELTNTRGVNDSRHMLAFLQTCLQPMDMDHDVVYSYNITEHYCPTNVAMAGVNFEPILQQKFKLKVEITSKSSMIPWGNHCCLRIPKLEFKHGTEKILSNLIAYEQCSPNQVPLVSSYIVLMESLIRSSDDVNRLQSANILILDKVPSTEVLQIFKSLSRKVLQDRFCYHQEWKQLDEYCLSFWPWIIIFQNRAFTHIFGTTTWKTLCVIGALILFVLTFLQTFFTIHPLGSK